MAEDYGGKENRWRDQVRPAQQGDRAARSLLYHEFAQTVHAIVLAHIGCDQVEDVTQDVFCHVFASMSRLRDPQAFPGFLCTAARNAARDHLRRRNRQPSASVSEEPVSGEPSPEAKTAERETTDRVFRSLAGLPQAYRETLLMRLVSEMSGAEIAERTGMTHGSVRVNLTRGMALLRERLGPCLVEDRS